MKKSAGYFVGILNVKLVWVWEQVKSKQLGILLYCPTDWPYMDLLSWQRLVVDAKPK